MDMKITRNQNKRTSHEIDFTEENHFSGLLVSFVCVIELLIEMNNEAPTPLTSLTIFSTKINQWKMKHYRSCKEIGASMNGHGNKNK